MKTLSLMIAAIGCLTVAQAGFTAASAEVVRKTVTSHVGPMGHGCRSVRTVHRGPMGAKRVVVRRVCG